MDSDRSYEIESHPASLGGGWKLTLFEHGKEAGNSIFPIPDEKSLMGIDWMNLTAKQTRAYWLMQIAAVLPAAARGAYLMTACYDDAEQEGRDWVSAIG